MKEYNKFGVNQNDSTQNGAKWLGTAVRDEQLGAGTEQ